MFARSMLIVALLAGASAYPAQAAEWDSNILQRFVFEGSGSTLGYNPRLGVLLNSGNMYGSTIYGGKNSGGVVWSRDGSGKMRVVYSFVNGDAVKCGYNPSAMLVMDSGGVLYGTTFTGGPYGGGVVFSLTPANNPNAEWICKPLVKFANKGAPGTPTGSPGRKAGYAPFGGLLLHPTDGKLYGVAQSGGTHNGGVIFRINTTGSGYQVLYNFDQEGSGGYAPASALAVDAGGVMYGTTFFGGNAKAGTVYRITTAGTFKLLHQFGKGTGPAGARLGYQPTQGPLLVVGATLYGATSLGGCPDGDAVGDGQCDETVITPTGTLFSMTTAGKSYTVLHSFDADGSSNGGYGPYGGLIKSGTTLFGVAQSAGKRGGGVAFAYYLSNGKYIVLRSFDPDNDGYTPSGMLLRQPGKLIGTNLNGGGDHGTLFELTPP